MAQQSHSSYVAQYMFCDTEFFCDADIAYSPAGTTSALGHVWTAPWQELSDVAAALVGCGHVSGLLMRQVWPLALMLCADQVPIKLTHLEVR